MNELEQIANAVRQVGLSFSELIEVIGRFSHALIMLFADTEAGDWPDAFILLNRHVRTDLVPTQITGGRSELT